MELTLRLDEDLDDRLTDVAENMGVAKEDLATSVIQQWLPIAELRMWAMPEFLNLSREERTKRLEEWLRTPRAGKPVLPPEAFDRENICMGR